MPRKTYSTTDLVEAETPLNFYDASADTEEGLYIKGFVSLDQVDRLRDQVSPEAFDVPQFMAAPSILVNHSFWVTPEGNKVSVGTPKNLNLIEVVKLKDDESSWGIKDLQSKQLINTYPKVFAPNISAGDRGLFMVALITEKGVIEKVRKRELNAFSWKGFSKVDYRYEPEGTVRVIKSVDLVEISLVNGPVHQNSSFIIGKSIYMVSMEKGLHTQDSAAKFLRDHNFLPEVNDRGKTLVSKQLDQNLLELSKLELNTLSTGIQVVTGPISKNFEELLKMSIETEKEVEKVEETKVEETKPDQSGYVTVESFKSIFEEYNKVVSGELTKLSSSYDKKFEELTSSIQTLAKSLEAKEEMKEEVKEEVKEEKEEVAKSTAEADLLSKFGQVIAETLNKQTENSNKTLEAISKSLEVILKSTPTETPRKETLDPKVEKYNLFDSVMPFKVS